MGCDVQSKNEASYFHKYANMRLISRLIRQQLEFVESNSAQPD